MNPTCADSDCQRPAVRTRQEQRWCMYHPDSPAPEIDMLSGNLRHPEKATPLRKKTPAAKPVAYREPGRVVDRPAARRTAATAAPTPHPRPTPTETAAAYDEASASVQQVAAAELRADLDHARATATAQDNAAPLRAGLPWATTGGMGGRTVHGASGELLGMMDSPGLAATVVQAVNDWVARKAGPEQQQVAAELDPLGVLRRAAPAAATLAGSDAPPRVRAAAAGVTRALAALDRAAAGLPPAERRYSPDALERMRANGRRLASLNAKRRAEQQKATG